MEKTTQDLATELNVTPRMINVYRAAAEKKCGRKLGRKRGKTVYFSVEDQDLIIKARYNAIDTLKSAAAQEEEIQETPETSQNFREAQSGNSLQGELAGGLIGVKESLHSGGIALGRKVGQEFAAGLRRGIEMELQELVFDLELVSKNLLAVTAGAAVLPSAPADDLPSITGTGAGFW